jgi:hypothetical protein
MMSESEANLLVVVVAAAVAYSIVFSLGHALAAVVFVVFAALVVICQADLIE